MVALAKQNRIDFNVADATGQKTTRVTGIDRERTVGDMLREVLPSLRLPATDSTGRPVVFRARLEREGRYLNESEVLGDVVQPEDRVTLQPNIEAGRGVI